MKFSKVRMRRHGRGNYSKFVSLEMLEVRTLLSGAVSALAQLPNEASLTNPSFSNEWYYNNTGQTITNASQGPSVGKAGADINATDAWDLTTGSSNVVVAVFDTGVDLTDSDLAANVWTNPGIVTPGFTDDIHGWNFVDGNNNVQDTIGHGTTVNGVIGAVGNNGEGIAGVAWNVKLLEVKVGDASGVSDANLQAGINYVIKLKQEGVNIVAINASYFGVGALSLTDFNYIQAAGNAGILYVAAAGNSSLDLDSFIPNGFLPSNLIFVAATDAQDNLASFSDYGQNSVALGAPGVDITTTILAGLDATLSGTSYAGPMVSGTIALMKSLEPGATMAQLKSALLNGTDTVAGLAGKTEYGRLDAFKSLELLQGDIAPEGHVDVLTSTSIVGWAYDANAGLKPVTVELVVDGQVSQTTTANQERDGLTAYLGSPDHQFSFTVANTGGVHTYQVVAVDYSPYNTARGNVTLATQQFDGPVAPIGSVDLANTTAVKGWALDQNTPTTAVTVELFVDGTLSSTQTANLNRPDLVAPFGSADHGYSFAVPALTATFHRLDVYALDTTTSAAELIGSKTVSGNVAATGSIDVFNGSVLKGWAVDPDTTATSIKVQYSVDGGAPVRVTASLSRPGLVALYGSADHAYSVTLPQLTVGTHSVTVWAIDADTGVLVPLGTRTATVAQPAGKTLPRGSVDIATSGQVAGWAFDANEGTGAIEVRVDVDGVMGTPFFANASRPDLVPVLGSGGHGFNQSLNLSAGEHMIEVYAIGSPSDEVVLLGRKLVGQAASRGSLDLVSTTKIAGWAYNAGAGSGPVYVRLDVDGVAGPVVPANLDRPDLVAAVGSPDHGYSFVTPELSPGTHVISITVLDPYTLQATTVMTGSLVVT